MSMSTHVVGFVPPDEEWRKMKAVWDACKEIDAKVPVMVGEFFEWGDPDPCGAEVDLDDFLKEYNEEGQSGYEVSVEEIPAKVKVLRFYNSW